ncbi:MAG TPA: DUF2378 family protein [Myxococcus sp.]|jgi:uncharacterized protein (TIGR02265 family)|nr:DUF2378 family protein [Myxococcus sp.]
MSKGAPSPPSAGSTTSHAVFEGLFHRALHPTGAFADALREAGYDLKRPQSRYPTHVWHACLEVARRHAFGSLPEAEGYRRMGHRFIEGWFETIIGKIIAVGLPLLGPERALERAPRTWSAAQPDLKMELRKQAERHWEATLREQGVLPDFCAGLLEGSARVAGAPAASVTVRERGLDHCVLEVRW